MFTKETILSLMYRESYRPLGYKELLDVLGIKEVDEEIQFSKVLGQLEKEGEIVRTRKNKFGLPEMMNLVKGVLHLNPRGYGIVLPDKPGQPEVFVFGKNMNGAMHNDKVIVQVNKEAQYGQRPEGSIIRIIKRANQEIVGTLEKGKRFMQVIPDDPRMYYPIYVVGYKKAKARVGDKVVVSITSWPDGYKGPEGKIIEVLGKTGEPGLDLQVIIRKYGLRSEFSEKVIKEARQAAVPVSQEEISQRRDLRNIRMITIDGEDAKDLDDAVSIARTGRGYHLGVHIADVSHYVKENSQLDQEAFKRGTSVYLVDHVLPMLPKELSNGICSLNAGEDRLAISCLMNIDDKGKVVNYDLCKSVINVDKRMTYTAVNKILAEGGQEERNEYPEIVPDLELMAELSAILRKDRLERGALDFDFPESKVIVDKNGTPTEIRKVRPGVGEKIIEDFMIKANEVVAEHMYWREAPILYRVHEKPDEDGMTGLNRVLGVFGHRIRANQTEPKAFQKVLREIKGRPEEQLISLIMLRSMKHAKYYPVALGHFGLASRYYCHFTSPIRRYPDLIVHRVLSALLDGSLKGKRSVWENKMGLLGEHSTLQEMKAEEAERELVDIKKAQYMKEFLGEEFTAQICSVQSFGFFVELENTVQGLVHVSSLDDDYYEFNERNYTLVGTHSGRKFAIGDRVRVQLVRVETDAAKIDFELVE
ncbi:MAG: ribonuclease R [Syntrophomonadaceae bacterium]|jgi:ribonuclease R